MIIIFGNFLLKKRLPLMINKGQFQLITCTYTAFSYILTFTTDPQTNTQFKGFQNCVINKY